MLTVEFSRGRAVLGVRALRRPERAGQATVRREKSEISGSAFSEQDGAVRGSTLRTTKHTGYSQAQAATG